MVTITIDQLGIEVIVRAIFTIAFVIVASATGLKLISKYRKYKNTVHISVGLTWIFIASSYWALTIGFLSILIFSIQPEHAIFLILAYGFIPIAFLCWIYSFAKLYNEEKFKLIFYPLFAIYFALFVIQLVLILLNYENVAIYKASAAPNDPFQYNRKLILYLVAISALLLVLISGTLFCVKSFKSKDKKIIWKGRFLLAGFWSFTIGTLIDIFSFGSLTVQIIARLILILSSVLYYLGWFLPPGIERMIKA